jgi:hypothetical protein
MPPSITINSKNAVISTGVDTRLTGAFIKNSFLSAGESHIGSIYYILSSAHPSTRLAAWKKTCYNTGVKGKISHSCDKGE